MSELILPLVSVDRVSKLLPQAQVTVVTTYSGWIPGFMDAPRVQGRRVASAGSAGREPDRRTILQRREAGYPQPPEVANGYASKLLAAAGRRLLDRHQELGVGLGLLH